MNKTTDYIIICEYYLVCKDMCPIFVLSNNHKDGCCYKNNVR